jgi:hypothetical protein
VKTPGQGLDRTRLTLPATTLSFEYTKVGPERPRVAFAWRTVCTVGPVGLVSRALQNALPATMRTLANALNSAERMIPLTSKACSLNSWNGTSSTSVSPTIRRIS